MVFVGKALIKLFEYNAEEVNEDLKMFVIRQREKIIEKAEYMLRSPEKSFKNEIRAAALNALAIFSRLDPPMHKSFYDTLLYDALNLLCKENIEDFSSPYWEATENTIQTILHFNMLRAFMKETITTVSWFRMLTEVQQQIELLVKKCDEAQKIK